MYLFVSSSMRFSFNWLISKIWTGCGSTLFLVVALALVAVGVVFTTDWEVCHAVSLGSLMCCAGSTLLMLLLAEACSCCDEVFNQIYAHI